MDPETRAFLVKILNTVSLVLIWMIANVFIGIYKGFAFFDDSPHWTNFVYYAFALITFAALFIHLKRRWNL